MRGSEPEASAGAAVKGRAGPPPACDAGSMDTQDAPIQDGSDEATNAEKIAGLAQQMRADADAGIVDDLRGMARQRLEDAKLPTDEATVDQVVGGIRSS